MGGYRTTIAAAGGGGVIERAARRREREEIDAGALDLPRAQVSKICLQSGFDQWHQFSVTFDRQPPLR